MIVVYWISIKGFSPGRRVSTAIYGMTVVTMSDDGNGELEGFMVVGIYEGVAVGRLLGDFDGISEGNCVGKFTVGVRLGVEEGAVKVGSSVGVTVGVLLGEYDGCVLGRSVVGDRDG